MQVKPQITLLFVLSVLTVLLLLATLFPENGIPVGNTTLRFASLHDVFNTQKAEYADISYIIERNEETVDSITAISQMVIEEEPWDTIRADAGSLKESVSLLQFAPGNRTELHAAFRAMEKASTGNKPVRVLHYGDSQIEGDRITSFLRNRLQRKFGGMGVGLIPVEQTYDFSFSIFQDNSSNWKRYTLYGRRDTTLTHRRYGALASFCRFTPYSTLPDKEYEEWVSISQSPYAYSNTKHFEQCRIFYSHNTQPFIAELYLNDALADADMYPASSSLQTIQWNFDEPVSEMTIAFKGNASPDIYGITLDGKNGIAVDNIAMRGNSGLVFTKMDEQLLRAHYNALDVKLIILQFGGNIVPHVVRSYKFYENLFANQLHRLRQVLPNASIIVIGVADMSIKEKNRYVSYPNIEKVRNALKNASFREGAAYWDMYEAMGGKNSMPSWVFAQPPLASSDFVHFTPRGAKIIANMFYNALMHEYETYRDYVREITPQTNQPANESGN